ncbi:MAG: helix-turn-helix domain-containing protein [Ruminococcaceae bacterium]|nr:helix-turn-helix domain-containing protein [Oscillospiraceae bacterium]
MQAFYEKGSKDLYCRDSEVSGGTIGYTSHLHYQIELAMIFDGHTHITVDSAEYDALSGDAFVVFPNQIHSFTTVKRESYVLLKINPDYIPELLPLISSSLPKSAVIKGAANDRELAYLVKEISNVYHKDEPFKDAILRGLVLVFLSKVMRRLELSEASAVDYHAVGIIMDYCNKNYNKPLSLGILSKELHLNKYYISHVISEKLNIGFNDYINSLRVSNACKLLVKSDRTVTEISEAVGFNTMRTFNRAFMKQMSCTPSEYRQKKRNESISSKKTK